MFRFHKKKILVASLLLGGMLLGIAAYPPYRQQPRKRNLKVLPANISRDSLDAIMDAYKLALGVKCSFCHAPRAADPSRLDFSSDDKPEKEITRHMMRMTSEINQKFFNFNGSARPDTIQAVTCITCHRGNAYPEEALKGQ